MPDHNLDIAESSYKSIISALNRIRLQFHLIIYSKGLFLWILSLSLLIIAWFIINSVLHIPLSIRFIMVITWLVSMLASGYFLFFRELLRRSSIERLAFRLDQHYPESNDRLISSLQLWRNMYENKYGYSESFIRMVVEEARELFDSIDRSKVFSDDLKKLKRSSLAMLSGIILLSALIMFFPSSFYSSVQAFLHPLTYIDQNDRLEIIKVLPGNYIIQPGDSVEIIAEISGNPENNVMLQYKTDKNEMIVHNIWYAMQALSDDNRIFRAKLNNIREPVKYYVSVDNIKSQEYMIKVVDKPIINNLRLELHYPRYVGISNQVLPLNTGDVSAPIGTNVMLTAESNKELVSAFMVYDNDIRTRLNIIEKMKLKGSFVIKKNGKYHISVTDVDNQNNSDPIGYFINAVADQPPKVSIVQPGRNTDLGQDMLVPLQVSVLDDHGISKLALHYQVDGQDNKGMSAMGSYEGQQASISLKYLWNLSSLRLFPEDTVSYYVEASDSDNVTGPNIGRSEIYTVRYPSLYEIYKKMEDEQQNQESEMKEILSQQDDVKEAVNDIIKELKKKDEPDWADKKELEKAAAMQENVDEKLKDLSKQFEETIKKMEENPLVSSQMLEKVQEIRDLINEIATEEMKQIMQKLSEAINKANLSQQQKDLMAASFKQEEFMEKLDRIIELFKNMRLKQRLEIAMNQAGELVQKQTEIMDQTEQLSKSGDKASKSMSDREFRMKSQVEQLQNELREIVEETKEKMANISQSLGKVGQRAEQDQIAEQLQMAGSELQNKPSKSMPFQKKAIGGLSRLQSGLQKVVESMQSQDMSEIMAALREATRKSLYASHKYEDIAGATSSFGSDPEKILPKEKELMDSLASDQLGLSEGVRNIASELKELSRKTPAIRTELIWELEKAADGIRRSAKAMEDKMPILAEPIQKNSLAILNKAIEDMLDSMEQINSQSVPMMGLDDYMEQLRQLAEQQSQLNQSTQQADSQLRRQGITPSIEEMLEKLAAEQELIREATERLASKLDQLAETMGSLSEVSREMRDVTEELRGKNIDRTTVEKQRRILTRLLDYEKSLKKQDFDKKREAQTGRDYVVEKPKSDLPEDAKMTKKQLDKILNSSIPEKWLMQYRELIKMYYKALSKTVKP